MSTPVTGQFKTWGELLLAALTQKREIQYNRTGATWGRSEINNALSFVGDGDGGGYGISNLDANVAHYRLKPKTVTVKFWYNPKRKGELIEATVPRDASIAMCVPAGCKSASVEIEVDE